MWNPGFRFAERERAVIHGYHRSLCMYSHMYRGTPDRPGLVLGLDRGGPATASPSRLRTADWEETARLSARPRAGDQHVSRDRQAGAPCGRWRDAPRRCSTRSIAAIGNMPGRLSLEQQLHHVRQGHGQSGSCSDYVLSTVQHLREAGIRDRRLEQTREGACPRPSLTRRSDAAI